MITCWSCDGDQEDQMYWIPPCSVPLSQARHGNSPLSSLCWAVPGAGCPSQVTDRTWDLVSVSDLTADNTDTSDMSRLILLCLACCSYTRVVVSQTAPHPVKLGEIVHNMLFPSNELIGQIIDNVLVDKFITFCWTIHVEACQNYILKGTCLNVCDRWLGASYWWCF